MGCLFAGDSTIYTATQFKAFRGGAGLNDMMNNFARRLSDDEVRAMAEWFACIQPEFFTPDLSHFK